MTYKKNYQKKSKEQIKQETKETMEKVLLDIQQHYTSQEDMLELANFMAKFSNYSHRNMQLIHSQFKGAYACASYQTFKEAGFHVKKGEKAMKIFHPFTKEYVKDSKTNQLVPIDKLSKEQKELVEKGQLKSFKQTSFYLKATAFDISQTNAKPEDVPKIFPNRQMDFEVTEENKKLLKLGIQALAEKEKIEIKMMGEDSALVTELGASHGSFVQKKDGSHSQIIMNTRNTETNTLSVAIHELAHAKLHRIGADSHTSHAPTKEFEAELVSYIVCKNYGMDTSEQAIPYIASWTKNGQDIEEKDKSIERVHETARSFIDTIDTKIVELKNDKSLETEFVESKTIKNDHSFSEQNQKIGGHFFSKEKVEFQSFADMVQELEAKEHGKYFTCKCPSCDHQEAYFYRDSPEYIKCNRENNCGETTAIAFKGTEDDTVLQRLKIRDKTQATEITPEQKRQMDWITKYTKFIQKNCSNPVLEEGYRGLSYETTENFIADLREPKYVSAMFKNIAKLTNKDYSENSLMTDRNLIIPIHNEVGKVDSLLLRSTINAEIKPKEIMLTLKKDNPRMFIEDIPKGADTIVISEAVLDGLSFREVDKNVGLIMMTGSNKTRQVEELIYQQSEKFRDKNVIVAMDDDKAGKKAHDKIAKALEIVKISYKTFQYPEGITDPNEFLQKDKILFTETYHRVQGKPSLHREGKESPNKNKLLNELKNRQRQYYNQMQLVR